MKLLILILLTIHSISCQRTTKVSLDNAEKLIISKEYFEANEMLNECLIIDPFDRKVTTQLIRTKMAIQKLFAVNGKLPWIRKETKEERMAEWMWPYKEGDKLRMIVDKKIYTKYKTEYQLKLKSQIHNQ